VADVLGDWPVDLEGAGWSPERPTCWLVEGLLVYLERDDAELLVGRIGELSPPGSRLAIVSSSESRVRDRSDEAETDAIVGLWRSGVPDDVTTWLAGHGWTAHDADPVELTTRYGRPGWVDADTVGAPKLVDARRR
jgi:methyltransferase (TIGR00027 family)